MGRKTESAGPKVPLEVLLDKAKRLGADNAAELVRQHVDAMARRELVGTVGRLKGAVSNALMARLEEQALQKDITPLRRQIGERLAAVIVELGAGKGVVSLNPDVVLARMLTPGPETIEVVAALYCQAVWEAEDLNQRKAIADELGAEGQRLELGLRR